MPTTPLTSPDVLRIAAVDDHPVVAEGVVSMLRRSGLRLDWLGAATTYDGLLELMLNGAPEVVLVDLHLHDGTDPMQMIRDLTRRDIRCVILTSERRPVPIRRAVAAGAVGLMLKSDPAEELAAVLRDLADERVAVSSPLAHALVTDEAICAQLSPRSIDILELLSEGHTRRTAARAFDPPLSESTVSTYLERVFAAYRRLGRDVNSTVDAVREATADGHLAPGTVP